MDGKLDFEWDGEELVIQQCDKMKTAPHKCETCKHRFVCFTERVKPDGIKISSKHFAHLDDIIKVIEKLGTD